MTWKSFWHDLWKGLSNPSDSETGDAKSGGAPDPGTQPSPSTPPQDTLGTSAQNIETANNTFDTNAMNVMGQSSFAQLNTPHW